MRDQPVAGALLAALALASWRLWWNLANGQDLFLDSWVLVHILRVFDGGAELLPRGLLTLQYPLSYVPFWPLAKLFGSFGSVKLVYPVLASLAAIPAFLLVRNGPLALGGVLSILLLPDLMIKSLNGTPQGVALPMFLLALYFALQGKRLPFVLAATAILFTHHLTGLITLVLYYTVVATPRSRDPGFLRTEWPSLVYFSLWPLYWAWTFANTQQTYLGPAFLVLAVSVGLPMALLLYAMAPLIDRLVHWAGQWTQTLSTAWIALAVGIAAAAGWLFSGPLLNTPGLSDAPVANRALVSIYAVIITAGLAAALSRRHTPLILFAGTLLTLGFANNFLGCTPLFDGLRVADYAAVCGLVALFAPGLTAPWSTRTTLLCVALLVLLGSVLRLQANYERLFAHTADQLAAARWVAANVPTNASIATDAKMSLLVLGEGSRNATFEGTWWLFDDAPIAPYVAHLNSDRRFLDRPIRYVLLSDYMFGRGAEVSWFTPAMRAPASLPVRLDAIGKRVYEHGGVAMWELDASAIAAVSSEKGRADFMALFASGLMATMPGGPCR